MRNPITILKKYLLEKPMNLHGNKLLSAVLVPIIEGENDYELLFEKRVNRPMRHSGEISFPGGKLEEGETPIETALRETHEEIGIEPEKVSVIGYLKPTKTKSSGFIIIPVVGYVSRKAKIKINPGEVEEVIRVPISELYKNRKHTILGPYYKIDKNVIWGATARIVEEFLKIWEKTEGI